MQSYKEWTEVRESLKLRRKKEIEEAWTWEKNNGKYRELEVLKK